MTAGLDSTNNFQSLDNPIRLAITGGTDAYMTARGQITEEDPNPTSRRLDIQLWSLPSLEIL
jgi:hypothetical protein